MRRRRDDILSAFFRLILRVFFRSVEVVGAERIPRGRPLVLVANHVNGLIDPLFLLGPLPVHPHLLAKHTLWKNPVVRPWADLAGAIPVYRRQDQVDTAQNEETFARCHEVLAEGGAVALFPEGKSHSEPALQPLKTGLARIVLGYERKRSALGAPASTPAISPSPGGRECGWERGPGGEGRSVRIVPIGLLFDAKVSFRSRALVQVGEPIDPAPEVALDRADNVAAVRALTERVSQALEEVTLSYDTWEEARLILRAAELYGRAQVDLPGRRRLAEQFPIQQAFLEGYEDLRRRFPERVEAVVEAVRSYDRLLKAVHLRDDQVAAAYPFSPVLRFAGRTLLRLLFHLPLALVGTVLNFIPYQLIHLLAPPIARRIPDQIATYKLLGAVLFYPLTWGIEAWLAARYLSPWLGGWAVPLTLLIGPVTGYIAVLFYETSRRFWQEARAYLLLRTRKKVADELRACRETLLREVRELEELWRAGDHASGAI